MANAKEIYEVISGNPKISNFIKKYGLIVDAKPLSGAHGATSYYLDPTFGKITITLDQKSHDSIETAEQHAYSYEKSGFKMPCDKAHAPHYTESHALGYMIEAIVCYERLKNVTWITAKEFKQKTNKIKKKSLNVLKILTLALILEITNNIYLIMGKLTSENFLQNAMLINDAERQTFWVKL